VETISSVTAGLQPSADDIPDVKKVLHTLFKSKIFFQILINCLSFSVQIVIEMHLLSVHCVVVHRIVLHFVKVKTGITIKWNVTTLKEALCLLYKLKNETFQIWRTRNTFFYQFLIFIITFF
jgi:hypothetical protein